LQTKHKYIILTKSAKVHYCITLYNSSDFETLFSTSNFVCDFLSFSIRRRWKIRRRRSRFDYDDESIIFSTTSDSTPRMPYFTYFVLSHNFWWSFCTEFKSSL